MDIPHDRLPPDVLHALIEEFVTRDGTDYGEREASLETKIAHVMRQIEAGKVTVVFDPETESCDLREVQSSAKP
ncbi:MAG: YheU family protein [Methylotenera sp.]|nr:YheU family protein [Oligoflexia bacterium]